MRKSARLCTLALVLAVVAGAGAVVTATAHADNYGEKWLTQGSCCSGAPLQGTRTGISESNMAAPWASCIMITSAVSDAHPSTGGGPYTIWLENGLAECGGGTPGLDNEQACLFGDTHLYMEEFNGSQSADATCYAKGVANAGQQYELAIKETSATSGIYTGTINGYQPLSWSGFDSNITLKDFGEQNLSTDCSNDWSVSGAFSVWQRWNYQTNSWFTIQSAESSQSCAWSVTPLYYINSNDQYFYADANYP